MIVGTSYSPAKAFINFACQFFEALSCDDIGKALSKIDMSHKKWTKNEINTLTNSITKGRGICSPIGIAKSASPELQIIEEGNVYILNHKIPCNGKWLNECVTFKFERAKGDYFSVKLEGFKP